MQTPPTATHPTSQTVTWRQLSHGGAVSIGELSLHVFPVGDTIVARWYHRGRLIVEVEPGEA